MSIMLVPRVYRNLRWSLLTGNKIDTVVMSPIKNLIGDPTSFQSQDFTTANVNGSPVTLPIANTVAPSIYRYMYNFQYLPDTYTEYPEGSDLFIPAKARVEVVMGEGSAQLISETAIAGSPSISIDFEGTSAVITEASKTFNDYPTLQQLHNSNFSLAGWIEANKVSTSETLTHSYKDNICALNPWVSKLVPYPAAPEISDFISAWSNSEERTCGEFGPYRDPTEFAWTDFCSSEPLIADKTAITMLPYGITSRYRSLRMPDISNIISLQVDKVDDFTFNISWKAPIRVAYASAARTAYCDLDHATFSDVANYAYVDSITKVIITLNGQPYNTDAVNVSYSMSGSSLTTDVSNVHPYKIDKYESITLASTFGGVDWTRAISSSLLTKYKNGKYVVSFDVPAVWALTNDVHINTEMQVKLQDGTILSRNGIPCTFEVKTIEKRFNSGEFTYSLKVLEK